MYIKDVRVNLSQFIIDKAQTAIKSDHTPGVKRKIRVKSPREVKNTHKIT